MTPTRASAVAAALAFAPIAALIVGNAMQRTAEMDAALLQATVALLVLGAPFALAAAILVGRIVAAARGGDGAERLLSVATAGLPSSREEWGTAMRAELASIDDSRERRQFATSAGWAAVRSGFGPRLWLLALGIGIAAAAATLATSRLILAGDRVGIIVPTLLVPPLALLVVGAIAARSSGGFRAGLEAGACALVALFIGVFAATMAEAVVWFEAYGVFVLDGDAPKRAIDVVDAVLDPFSTGLVVLHLLLWVPYPVLGAAIGAASHVRRGTVVAR